MQNIECSAFILAVPENLLVRLLVVLASPSARILPPGAGME